MFKFFDYVFYCVCTFYYKNNDSSPIFAGLAVLSLMQVINIFTIVALIFHLLKYTPNHIKLIVGCTCIIVTVLNGFRYNKFNYNILNERWKDDNSKIQKKKGTFVVLYLLLTIPLAFLIGFIF